MKSLYKIEFVTLMFNFQEIINGGNTFAIF